MALLHFNPLCVVLNSDNKDVIFWITTVAVCVCLQEFVFGTLTEWLHIYNIYLYCGLWVLNGLLQSAVWPCVVAVMGNWFGKTGCVAFLCLQNLHLSYIASSVNHPASLETFSQAGACQVELYDTHPHTETRSHSHNDIHSLVLLLKRHLGSEAGLLNIIC